MSMPLKIQSNIKAGTCPHGLPHSSCPVCSKQGGAGVFSRNINTKKSAAPKQWSYQKCYLVGMQMRAAQQRTENARNFYEKQMLLAMQINKNIQAVLSKINQFLPNINLPKLHNTLKILINNTLNPVFKTISNLTKLLNKFSDFQQKAFNILLQAGEKLVNILGEIKNFVENRIFKTLKEKTKNFILFCLSVTDEENYKSDDTLAVFKARELRKYIIKILKKRRDNEH